MTYNTKCKSKILAFLIGFAMSFALLPSIAYASPIAMAADPSATIDSLAIGFKKANVGDKLISALDFADEGTKMLRVADGANYTAELKSIWGDGQKKRLWQNGYNPLPWSNVENVTIEPNLAYAFRVQFAPKAGYKINHDDELLRNKMKVIGAEAGKGKDIEIGYSASYNSSTTAVEFDFYLARGMTYRGYTISIAPILNEVVTGKIGTPYTDTGYWLAGAPGPYTYSAKYAPVGMELQGSNVFDKSECYYRLKATNSMMNGMMYVTATASDGQICDIPVLIYGITGGHDHKWADYGKIDYEYHGYTKCTDPDCPGICYQLDIGSLWGKHDFSEGCNVKCKKCGDVGNPDAKHNFSSYEVDRTDKSCHIRKCTCGEYEKDSKGNIIQEKHHGGKATCLSGAICEDCEYEYMPKIDHAYHFKAFSNNDGTYTHLAFCDHCGKEDVSLRHSPAGGTATCQKRARCTFEYEGSICDCEYGDYLPHVFVDDVCTNCSSGKVIKDVEIAIPEYRRGMSYKPLFSPTVTKGNIIPMSIYYHGASLGRDANHYLCNGADADTVYITNNSVMRYAFMQQTNCEFPSDLNELNVTLNRGKLLNKKINPSNGSLLLYVLLPLDDVVTSVNLEFSIPIAGQPVDTLKVVEKNGLEITLGEIGPIIDGGFYENVPCEVPVTVKAPKGMIFPAIPPYDLKNWLLDYTFTNAKMMSIEPELNTELTEVKFYLQTERAIECPHVNVTRKEPGKLATCTEAGIKDKYVCSDCGKEFSDSSCTVLWDDSEKVVPAKGHDYNTEYTQDKEKHYHECKNCDAKKDEAAHDFTTLTPEVAATCTTKGVKAYYYCSICDAYADEKKNIVSKDDLDLPIDSNAHQYGGWVDEVDPTATEFGVMGHKDCVHCGKHFDANNQEITDLRIAKLGTHKVTVNGETQFHPEGEKVTITADDPQEGKVFKGWKDKNGNIVTNDKSYTFTVTEELSFTAIYEDAPKGDDDIPSTPEKKGLPGGAIAGIVFGSVAVLGLGGFSIYWFAIAKKSFGDLAASIKSLFKKKK